MVWTGGQVDRTNSSDHIELTISDQPSPLHNKNASRDNILNVSRTFEMPTEVIAAATRPTPGIVSCATSRSVQWEGSTTPYLCTLIDRLEAPW